MKPVFDKKAYICSIIAAVLSFLYGANVVLELIPALGGTFHIINIFAAVLIFVDGLVTISIAVAFKKKSDPFKLCKWAGIYMMVYNPVLLFTVLIQSFSLPVVYTNPLFWTGLGITTALFGIRILQIIFIVRKYDNRHPGYFPYRNHAIFAIQVAFTFLGYYVFGALRSIGMAEALQKFISGEIEASSFIELMPATYFIFIIVAIAVNFVGLVIVLYIGFTTLISGIEKQPMDFKNNIGFTKALLRKYSLLFWLSIFINLLMLAIAVGTFTSTFSMSMIPLIVLYVIIIVVRVPAFFWNNNLEKKEQSLYVRWRKKHGIYIYAAILIIVYTAVSFIFGSATQTQSENIKDAFMTFVVFLPIALIKIVLGMRKLVTADHTGDPYPLLNAHMDILLSIFTGANTLFLVANITGIDMLKSIGTIIGQVLNFYALYIAVRMLITGIRGISDRRRKTFERYKPVLAHMSRITKLISSSTMKIDEQEAINKYVKRINAAMAPSSKQEARARGFSNVARAFYLGAMLAQALFFAVYITVAISFLAESNTLADAVVAYVNRPEITAEVVQPIIYFIVIIAFAAAVVLIAGAIVSAVGNYTIHANKFKKALHIWAIILSVFTFQPLMLVAAIFALVLMGYLKKHPEVDLTREFTDDEDLLTDI